MIPIQNLLSDTPPSSANSGNFDRSIRNAAENVGRSGESSTAFNPQQASFLPASYTVRQSIEADDTVIQNASAAGDAEGLSLHFHDTQWHAMQRQFIFRALYAENHRKPDGSAITLADIHPTTPVVKTQLGDRIRLKNNTISVIFSDNEILSRSNDPKEIAEILLQRTGKDRFVHPHTGKNIKHEDVDWSNPVTSSGKSYKLNLIDGTKSVISNTYDQTNKK